MNWKELIPLTALFGLGFLAGAMLSIPSDNRAIEQKIELQRDSILQLEIIEEKLQQERQMHLYAIDSIQVEYRILEDKYAALYEEYIDINIRVRDLGHDTLVSSIRRWIRHDPARRFDTTGVLHHR